jgi:O-antigen/teichoic acid export membrane protein
MKIPKVVWPPNVFIALAEIVSKIATFFILPISGLFLTTSDFNLWSIIFPSIQILAGALSFGLPSYLLRSYFLANSNKIEDNLNVFNFFVLLTIIYLLLFIPIHYYFNSNPFISWTIFLILLTNSFLLIIQQKYQAEKKGVEYFYQSIVWRIGFALFLIFLLFFKTNNTLNLLLYFLLLLQFLIVIYSLLFDCKPFKFKFNYKRKKEIFNFGIPLFFIAIMQYIIYMNSRYFIYNKGNEFDTSSFSLIHTFIGSLNLLFVVL